MPAAIVLPSLTLSGTLSFTTSSVSGTLVANIGNVPAGVTPTLTPNDGRLVIAGSAGAWTVVTGLAAATVGTFVLTVLATGANPAAAVVTVVAGAGSDIPPILTNFTIGMNGNGTQAYHAGVLNRDLSRKGEWIIQGGASNNQTLPASMLDRQAHFPISLPADATGVVLKILDGGWYDALGQFTLAIDNRFTVTSSSGDAQVVLTGGTGGTGTINITGVPRPIGWNLNVTGPFGSLTPAQRGLRILPANDANPTRLYSDGIRAMLETAGARDYRVMEDVQVNEWGPNPLTFFGDFGAKTGTTSGPIDVFVQLCNDLNMSLHYAFHPYAPQAHVLAICRYVAQTLKKGLKFTVEYSNEIWNRAFRAHSYMQEKGWEAGLYGAGNNGTKPPCLGWENGNVPFAIPFGQYFLPNYKVNPDDANEPNKGQTTQALTAGTYVYGDIYGFGSGVFLVANNVPQGYVFPFAGDGNMVRQADDGALEDGKWRHYSVQSQALLATASAQWLAEGHQADNLTVALNVQSGPFLGYEDLILSHPDGSFKLKNFEVNQAPYWSTFYGDVGNLTLAKTLDAVAAGDRAQINDRRTWVSNKRALLQGIMPAGRTLKASVSGTYEVNHHNGFFSGTDNTVKFKALRRDRRTGHNLKYAMTLFGLENPGGNFRVFNLITGELDNTREGWGVFFSQNEALNGPLVNPEGIALKEWNLAATTGIPVADIFCPLQPDEGAFQVQIQFGPQVASAISGVLRVTAGTAASSDVTGGLPLDIPFTKAAGAVVATVTVPVIDDTTVESDETLVLNIVPQPGVFTIGSLSQNVTVTVQNNDIVAELPKTANKKIDFNPSAMAQQTDGTAFTRTMTDTVSGIQAVQPTSANQPTWVANAAGGKPGIRANGSQWLNINAPGIYKTIIDTKVYTIIDLVIGTQVNGQGCVGGGSSDGSGFFPVCDGSFVGNFSGGSDRTQVPYAATAFSAIGFTSTTANKGGVANTGLTRTYVNGMCISSSESAPQTASNTTNFALFALNSAGVLPAKTTLLRRLVFDVELTPGEYLQWVMSLFAEYNIAHPLAAVNEVKGFDGDSLTNGVGSPVATSLGFLVAQTNNYPMGTWFNTAIGGSTSQECINRAPTDVDSVITASGKRGIIFFQERANDQPGVTPAQGGTLHTTYISARKAANSTAKVIGQTPADWANAYASTSPDAWNTYLIANSVSIGYSALARVDLNATIGSNGGLWNTYPETGPWNSPFKDGVHFATYAIQAGIIAPLMAAA